MGKNGQKLFHFCDFFFGGYHFCVGCWTENYYFFCSFFFAFWDWGWFILLLLQETVRTLDSRIAVHYCTGIQMLISWTLGLQSIAQISTNKHDSGLPVFQQTSSNLVHNSARMAHKMPPCHFISIIVHESKAVGQTPPQLWHSCKKGGRGLCISMC